MVESNYRIKELEKGFYNSLSIFLFAVLYGIIAYVLDYFGYVPLSFFYKWYSELNLKMFLSENNFRSFINWVSLGRVLGLGTMVNLLWVFCNDLYLIAKIVLFEIGKYISNNKFIFLISYVIYWFLFFYLIVQFLVFYLNNLDNYLLFIGAIFIVPLLQSLTDYLKLYFYKKNIDQVNHIFYKKK